MSHRREQKEALRREREKREAEARAAAQRKRLVGFAAAAVIAIAAVAIVVAVSGGSGGDDPQSAGSNFPTGGSVSEQKVFDLNQAASAAGCELKSNKSPSRNVNHLTDPNQKWHYKQNPPTSGRHYQIPAEDGLYNGAPPPDTALVHALEHGRVIIWVKPSLPAEDRAKLRALFEEDGYQMIMVRRPNMPYAVAATAWNRDPTPDGTGRLMGCTRWDDGVIDALRSFRDEHRSNGPEDIP